MLLLMNKGFRWPEKRTPHYGDPTLKKKKKHASIKMKLKTKKYCTAADPVAKVTISRSVIPFNLVFPGKFLFWNEVFVAFISEVNLF